MNFSDSNDIKQAIDDIGKSNKERSLTMLTEILDLLPHEYSDLISESFTYKRIPKEYLLTSILFAVSSSIGLTFYIDELGYKNYANLYFTIIGSRGDVKSEAMKLATKPLKDLDDSNYDDYLINLKNCNREIESEPVRKQILVQKATIEAAHKIHSENPNSVGISMDEIYSLIDKMGNSSSRDGVDWKIFFLEGYTNGYIDISRKTTESFRIKETYPTLLGGLQHQFVSKLFANGNLESGFIDRLLFAPKLTYNSKLSRGKISLSAIELYNYSIHNILAYKKQSENLEEVKKQFQVLFSKEAEDMLFEYTQKLIIKGGVSEPIIKEYIAKMQISAHKFCLLVHMIKKSSSSDFLSTLELESVELAIKLNEFYFSNFKIILEENLSQSNTEPSTNEIIKLAKKNNASQKSVSEITGLHKGTISKFWNKTHNNKQLATSNNIKNTG